MVRINHALSFVLIAALAALMPALALAEPKQPSEEESADATFAKSFLGKTYDDELDIEGWTISAAAWLRPRSMSANISARTAPIWC